MIKKFLKSFILITFGVLIVGVLVNAAQSYRVNNGATVTIDEWDICKKVTNNTGKDIFVPTNSSNEWNQFRTYYPTGISLGDCCLAVGSTCSVSGDCCSGYCYVDADGDRYAPATGTKTCRASSQLTGTDCCDSDSRAYPGATTYYTSTNNCGSWDYNCDGGTTKSSTDCTSQTSISGGTLCTAGVCVGSCSGGYKTMIGTVEWKNCGKTFTKYKGKWDEKYYCDPAIYDCSEYYGEGCYSITSSGTTFEGTRTESCRTYINYGIACGAFNLRLESTGTYTCKCQ